MWECFICGKTTCCAHREKEIAFWWFAMLTEEQRVLVQRAYCMENRKPALYAGDTTVAPQERRA